MKRVKINIALIFLSFFFGVIQAEAGLFDKDECDFMEEKPKPGWVLEGLSSPDYYHGVGLSEKRNSFEEQSEDSKQDALNNLAQSISVAVKSTFKKNIEENRYGVNSDLDKSTSFVSELKSENLLRDVNIKEKWLDRGKCILYTLAVVSRDSVEKVKNELIMKDKLTQMKEFLNKGIDKSATIDMGLRHKYLKEARHFLDSMDFKYLPTEVNKEVYYNQVNSALENIEKEIANREGAMLVVSINEDDGIPTSAKGKLLDYIRQGVGKADRLIGSYSSLDDSLKNASAQGFSLLGIVKMSKKVEVSPMGALKGTLEAALTVYNVETGKIQREMASTSAQIIGWTEEELSWDLAVEKIMQGDKTIFKELAKTEK